MILVSLSEIVSIGAIFPFLAVLTNPQHFFELPAAQPFLAPLGIRSSNQLLLALTIAFGVAALLAGVMRLILLKLSLHLSFATGADIGYDIYKKTLYQPYEVHLGRNTSEVIDSIVGKTTIVTDGIIMAALYVISTLVMLVFILIALVAIAPGITFFVFAFFSLIYLAIIKFTKKRLLTNSQYIADESKHVLKILQEGLGGIRDVLIDGTQSSYCQLYRNSDSKLRHAYASSAFISNSPRYLIEALGMLLIVLIAYFLAQESEGISKAIPVVGAIALAAQRMLPVMQISYSSWSAIRRNQYTLKEVIEFLDQPLPEYLTKQTNSPISFNKEIILRDVSFQYKPELPSVLNGIELTIPKGARVGFIGSTGSGKTTLLDIIMGLLSPGNGRLLVDETLVDDLNRRSWQEHLAHVPQNIFLSDASIAENIAFGVSKEEIDIKRVEDCAQQAQLSDFISKLPQGLNTLVGERGTRLSGGQRQRIGIARALYKKADVIIFDEATSALDSKTEEAVMQSIEKLSPHLTILIIAHRITTLKKCSVIIELKDGKILRSGNYLEIIKERKA